MDGQSKHDKVEGKHQRGHSAADRAQEDVRAAHEAYDLWKSHDPKDWDRALDERSRINKHNPKAWRKAMAEIDADEAAAAEHSRPRENQINFPDPYGSETSVRDRQADRDMRDRRQVEPELNLQQAQAPHDQSVPVHPGYYPDSKYAPPVPDSPAYAAAYNRPQPKFYGLDLGIVKLGVNSNGSLDAGVNVGIARAEVQAGLENRVDGEFMPIGGPLHARAGAGIGVNGDGLHSEVGAGANVFDVVNGDADFGARLGRHTGVDGDVRGKAGPVHAQGDAGAGVGPDGVNAYAGGNTGIVDAVGVRSGAHLDLNSNSGAGAGVGVRLGDRTLDVGPSVDTYGNRTVRPDIHLDQGAAGDPTFYPTGDRALDEGR